MQQLGLYIHFPYCESKCPYCDFNSHAEPVQEQQWLDCLLKELKDESKMIAHDYQVRSIYFGGGTPSLLSANSIGKILDAADNNFSLQTNTEISLEMNPNSSETKKLSAYRDVGVNRISIGIQSFNDQSLQQLGRVHDAKQALEAVERVKTCNFNSFNIDLMYGLPKQTIANARLDLQQAIELEPDHLSWYQLTIEPNTVFYSHKPKLPHSLIVEDIEQQAQILFKNAGYDRYEVSAYAKSDDMYCQHNLGYWKFDDYLGLGPGAHSKLTKNDNTYARFLRTRMPKNWFKDSSRHYYASKDPIFEYLLNRWRLFSQLSTKEFEAHTRLPIAQLHTRLAQVQDTRLLDGINPSSYGYLFLNELLEDILE